MATRKVHFYRANGGLTPAGTLAPVNLDRALAHIDGLPFNPAGRYLDDGEGNALCAWPGQHTAHASLALGLIRRSELPELERGGVLGQLPIPEDAGIVEQTHFVFFPDNIVGCLFNFFGPRVSKLRWYLRAKFPGTPLNLRFDPLIRQDILERLDQVGHIRVLKLGIRRSFLDRVEQADQTLGQGFRATLEASNAEQAEILLKPLPRRRNWLADRIVGVVRTLAREHDVQEDVEKFEVQAERADGGLEWIDVLKSRFIVERQVELVRGRRAVTPPSAYRAIETAYDELHDQLVRAAHVM